MTELTVLQQKMVAFEAACVLKFNEPMSKHTSFRVGGGAEVMAFPKSREELASVLRIAAELGHTPAILGAGTNVLAPDAGISGLVICLKDCMDGMEMLNENRICVMAGVTMLSRRAPTVAQSSHSNSEDETESRIYSQRSRPSIFRAGSGR